MADLVRVFTCASVIALGGFSATSGMLACSSDPETTPAGDDDDDDDNGKKDAGKTSSSSSSGATASSSSSSGDGGGGGGNCTIPVGTYAIGKPVYSVTAPGKVCDSYAKGGNEKAVALGDVAISKLPSGNYSALPAGAPASEAITLTQADDICQIAGGLQPFGQTVSVDGKDVNVKLEPSQYYTFDGTKVVARTAFNIDSDPPGAAGIACTMQTLANGIKK